MPGVEAVCSVSLGEAVRMGGVRADASLDRQHLLMPGRLHGLAARSGQFAGSATTRRWPANAVSIVATGPVTVSSTLSFS